MSYAANQWIDTQLYGPLQIWRDHAREVYILLLITATPWILYNFNKRTHYLKVLPSMLLFLSIQLLYDARLFAGGFYGYASIGALIHVYTFIFFMVILRQWDPIQDPGNLLKAFVLGGAVFTTVSLLQYAVNPSAVIWAGRFMGITSNAQHAAQYLAVFVFATTACVLVRNVKTLSKIIYATLAAIQAVIIMWTGSRTGALMLAIAAVVTLRTKLGQWAILLLVLIGAAVIAIQFLPESTQIAERLIDTTNTRSDGWQRNYQYFLDSPLIGDVTPLASGRPPIVENSYLAILRTMGLMGVALAAIFFMFFIRDLYGILKAKLQVGTYRDIALGALVMLAVGAAFEGYLLAVISVGSMSLYLFSLIASSELYLAKEIHEA
jgi:O-antigen ligase